ncbi:MAG: hypothetical protein ACLQVD_00300 [Capsulimonadaceae bacterium]
MSYADFTLSRLVKQFSLSIEENTDLYSGVKPATVRAVFESDLAETIPLALHVSTEKARSEFIIAPILTEFWRLANHSVGLHSGVDFTVDPEGGLAGVCDYIITRSPEQLFVTTPIILLVEAKNEDMKRGYAQCIAEMLAAQRFNERDVVPNDTVYGAVTVGNVWRFLELEGSTVRIDAVDYYVENLAMILGILLHMAAI